MGINNLKIAALVTLLTTGLWVSSANASIDVITSDLDKVSAMEDK